VDAKDHSDMFPLHDAVIEQFDRAVVLLLDHRADPNCQDRHLNTPLHYAAWGGPKSKATFYRLLECKADPYLLA
jgi:ankyrin repeat protein